MVTLPFAPAASAFLTAVDVLAISSQSAFEDLIMPGVAAQVRETLARVDTLERDIAAKLAQVSALQAELAVKSTIAARALADLEVTRRDFLFTAGIVSPALFLGTEIPGFPSSPSAVPIPSNVPIDDAMAELIIENDKRYAIRKD